MLFDWQVELHMKGEARLQGNGRSYTTRTKIYLHELKGRRYSSPIATQCPPRGANKKEEKIPIRHITHSTPLPTFTSSSTSLIIDSKVVGSGCGWNSHFAKHEHFLIDGVERLLLSHCAE